MKKTYLAAAMAAMLAPATEAKADMKASLEGFGTTNQETTYLRPNAWYSLPGRIQGWTWIEHYQKGLGYFGMSYLKKSLGRGFALNSEVMHADQLFTATGLGVGYSHKILKGYAAIKIIPAWFDGKARRIQKSMVGCAAGVETKRVSLSAFGQADLAAPGGPQWGYGEIAAMANLGKHLQVGYSGALKNNKGIKPRLEHRLGITIR